MASAARPAHPAPTHPPEQVRRIVIGLLPAIFIGAVDPTIVAVALYSIGLDLQGLALLPWVFSGYLVAATVCTPIYGKLSDVYGRRRLLTIALAVCFVASLGSALSQSMVQLIAFRVLQGLGAGSLFALAQAAVADVAPGPERARYQGYFSGVFAAAAVAGPMLGGYLTHYLSWRAVFWVNLPLVALALWLVRRVLAPLPVARHARRIDWTGAALLTIGVCMVLIGITRIGQGVGWAAPSTLALFAGGGAVLVGWVLQSTVAPEPIVPLELFRNRVVSASCVVVTLNFATLVGVSALLPLSMQSIGGSSPDEVALRMLPMTLAVPLGALMAGRTMVRWSLFRVLAVAGCGLAALALAGIALAPGGSRPVLAVLMLLLGLGLGFTVPVMLIAAQLAVGPQLIGVVTALTAFFRSLGGALGIALLTTLLFTVLGSAGDAAPMPRQGLAMSPDGDPQRLGLAFSIAFAAAAVVSMLGAVAAFGLPRLARAADPVSTRSR